MSLFTIKFTVNCQTQFGEVVYICGNTPELGNWNPQNAMRLYTDATVYPKWDPYKTITVRQGNKLLFKLCILNQDKNVRWEAVQGNREIVASENLLVEFTAHCEEIVVTPIVQEIVKPPRKKTCDILNELESDGSSSKEYWKQFMEDEEESVLYITLTTQMRRAIETQTFQILPFNLTTPPISSLPFDKSLQLKTQKTRQILHTTSNFYCIVESDPTCESMPVMGQDSYMIRLEQFQTYSIHNNTVPIIFHIESLRQSEENEACKEVFTNIERIVRAENILLGEKNKKIQYFVSLRLSWEPSRQVVELILKKKVSLILVETPQILEVLLDHLHHFHLPITTHEYHDLILHLNPTFIIKVKLIQPSDPRLHALTPHKKERVQHQNRYFDFIKRHLFESNGKSFVGWRKDTFVEAVKEDETLMALAGNRKNIMVMNAQKIEDFTSKLLTEMIALSAKPNFEVYIILEKMTVDIKAKFPASKNNKIVVLSKSGTLYANEQTFIDMFQNLNLDKNKFSQAMSKIHYGIVLGLESKQTPSPYEGIYQFKLGYSGRVSAQILKSKISQHNEMSLHKLVIQEKQLYKFVVKPFCLTEEFFVKAILENLSKYTHDDRSFVLNINMKNDSSFLTKSNTLFGRMFNNKQSVKMRNLQVLLPHQSDYTGVVNEQTIPIGYLEAQLEFMCEHFLAGSHIKSYKLDMLSPNRNRRSFANKIMRKEDQYETF